MEEKRQIKTILEELINSYEIKMKTVTFLICKVLEKIKSFHTEQITMTDRLKDILAKNRSLRKKDFDKMIADIRFKHIQREREISSIVESFCKEEEEIVDRLREILSSEKSFAKVDFNVLKKRMLNYPKERERRLSRLLKNFHQEQAELASALRKLLEKGSSLRIKDLKAMIKAFHIEHQNEISGVDEILEEFERVKYEINSQWQKVIFTVRKEGLSASP